MQNSMSGATRSVNICSGLLVYIGCICLSLSFFLKDIIGKYRHVSESEARQPLTWIIRALKIQLPTFFSAVCLGINLTEVTDISSEADI